MENDAQGNKLLLAPRRRITDIDGSIFCLSFFCRYNICDQHYVSRTWTPPEEYGWTWTFGLSKTDLQFFFFPGYITGWQTRCSVINPRTLSHDSSLIDHDSHSSSLFLFYAEIGRDRVHLWALRSLFGWTSFSSTWYHSIIYFVLTLSIYFDRCNFNGHPQQKSVVKRGIFGCLNGWLLEPSFNCPAYLHTFIPHILGIAFRLFQTRLASVSVNHLADVPSSQTCFHVDIGSVAIHFDLLNTHIATSNFYSWTCLQ